MTLRSVFARHQLSPRSSGKPGSLRNKGLVSCLRAISSKSQPAELAEASKIPRWVKASPFASRCFPAWICTGQLQLLAFKSIYSFIYCIWIAMVYCKPLVLILLFSIILFVATKGRPHRRAQVWACSGLKRPSDGRGVPISHNQTVLRPWDPVSDNDEHDDGLNSCLREIYSLTLSFTCPHPGRCWSRAGAITSLQTLSDWTR